MGLSSQVVCAFVAHDMLLPNKKRVIVTTITGGLADNSWLTSIKLTRNPAVWAMVRWTCAWYQKLQCYFSFSWRISRHRCKTWCRKNNGILYLHKGFRQDSSSSHHKNCCLHAGSKSSVLDNMVGPRRTAGIKTKISFNSSSGKPDVDCLSA